MPALFAALQANSSVGKLGSGVVFGHHGTALIAGAYIHDLHNDVPSQVLRAFPRIFQWAFLVNMRALCTVAITWKNRESSTPGSVVFANYASASTVHYVSHVGDDGTIVVHGDGFVRLECACRERHGSGGAAVSGPLSDARASGEPHDAPVGVSEQGASGRVDRRARARRTPCRARPGP